MRFVTLLSVWLAVILLPQALSAQPNRINYNNQQLFLSGSNLAWASFSNDIGPGILDTNRFADVMLSMHDNGGNVLRWWLHTNGTVTPEFDGSNFVIGPGTGTIADIRKVLDLAWQRGISVDLCLWSFDMLKSSNSATVKARNTLLLNDTNYTRAYINNCLIPMVNALKGHPAIVAWEIFNEPEGMSTEFGWSDVDHVPMSSIQRFVNLCAGAIHRTDTTAKVTSGAWSFYALTDAPIASVLAKTGKELSQLSTAEKNQIGDMFRQKYRSSMTTDEVIQNLQKVTAGTHQNYYSDSRLIAAGLDSAGKLDFYSVHYYSTSTPVSTSPFNNPVSTWGLDKPIVVGEFAMESGYGIAPGIATASLYDTLYQLGYAGAIAWSFTDTQISSVAHMLAGMLSMWTNHQSDVLVLGTGGAWPVVTITSPLNNSTITDTTAITITANASDSDGTVDSVTFYISDTIRIGNATTSPYTIIWYNVPTGTYNIKAVATDNAGHRRNSNIVMISVGKPALVRREAESTRYEGTGVTRKTDATASGGAFLDMAIADTTGKVIWYVNNGVAAGNYPIAFGYKLYYASPKSQFLHINGVRVDTLDFTAASTSTWYELSTNVNLIHGLNTIEMQMYWGWMYLDYLAVPAILSTGVENITAVPASFSLEQNYPNPFNPSTNIRYSLVKADQVRLVVYDILGRQIATLVDRKQNAGVYDVPFDAGNLTSGVYFYRITTGTFTQVKRMMVLK
jgi:hypothetical protein